MTKKYFASIFALSFILFLINAQISAAVTSPTEPTLIPVYSFWHSSNNYYLYTASESEKKSLDTNSSMKFKGISWKAFSAKNNSLVPIYRFKNTLYSHYYYTSSESEKNTMLSSSLWSYRGIGWYAYALEQTDTVPVYKIKNSLTKRYIFLSSPGEKNCFLNNYPAGTWQDKGIAFWVPKEGANVSTDENSCYDSPGPEITVGLWKYTRTELKDTAFKIDANKEYSIKDTNGNIIAKISPATTTKIKYDSNGNLRIYGSIPDKIVPKEVIFDSADGNNSNIIFDAYRPGSDYDRYRGKMKIRYTDSDNIWVINKLPLEQYAWGMGETTGTGPLEHTKVMTTVFRTYGYWYVQYATKYAPYGFKVRSDSGSQIYRGYDWEIKYPNIKKAAQQTRGTIVTYKNETAITPYSSWTDGRTRSFEERWGSTNYPWCKSVSDPYGKHPTKTTAQLVAEGNHMVGLSANGSVKLAGSSYNWAYDKILKYYFTGVSLSPLY